MRSLAEHRRRAGLSQRALARQAGLAYKTIQLIEAGRHDPRWSTLEKLAGVLGTDVAALQAPAAAPELTAEQLSARLLADGEDSWRSWLPDFVDGFRRRPRAGLAEAAPRPGLPPRSLALLASTVEQLCAEARRPAPWWCAGAPPLPEPWFVAGVEALKAAALVESPLRFRRRNIFVLGNFLERA